MKTAIISGWRPNAAVEALVDVGGAAAAASAPAARRQRPVAVAADLDGGQVGRHRLDLLVAPGDRCSRAPLLGELAVGDDGVVGGGGHGDRVRRLVVGPVVAREPRRGAVRLAGHDHAVGELLPAGVPVVLVDERPWVRRRT